MKRLDPNLKSDDVMKFQALLAARVVGQDRAVKYFVELAQTVESGITLSKKPLASVLLMGPTGTGKTLVAETVATLLHGPATEQSPAIIKVHCGEFTHGHEVSKLVGSPSGYVGHRETKPMLSRASVVGMLQNPHRMGFILFDEIDKAHHELHSLLLGVLDKGEITLGDNDVIDLSRCVVFFTSNDGSREISEVVAGKGIGFLKAANKDADQSVYERATAAAKKRFSPEFYNRLDKVLVFRPLDDEALANVLEVELSILHEHLISANQPILLVCTEELKRFLLKEGYHPQWGARHIKRAIDRFLIKPLSAILATKQVDYADGVKADYVDGEVVFHKCRPSALVAES